MHTSPARRVLRLRITLTRSDPLIWRTLSIDDDATMADLDSAIRVLFDWTDDGHHVFTNEYPPFDDDDDDDVFAAPAHRERAPGESPIDRCFLSTRRSWFDSEPVVRLAPRAQHFARGARGGSGTATTVYPLRRWGDRWSMIDLRDPEIADERTVSVAGALSAASPLFHQYSADCTWWCGIELLARDYAPASLSQATLDGGARRAPLQTVAGVRAHNDLMTAYREPGHPDHDDAVDRLARAVGPWSTFDPDDLDVESISAALADRLPWIADGVHGRRRPADDPPPRAALGDPLARLIEALPVTARDGLRRHVRAHGLLAGAEEPTSTDAEALLRPFLGLIDGIGPAGMAIGEDGPLPATLCAAIDDATGGGVSASEIADTSRALHLIYRRMGRIRVPQRILAVHGDPVALWRLVTDELRAARRDADPAEWLFLLAVADGGLQDGSWAARTDAALESIESGRDRAPRISAGRDPLGFLDGLRPYAGSTPPMPIARLLAAFGLRQTDGSQWIVPAGLPALARSILQPRSIRR